jgi:hypothetical protein
VRGHALLSEGTLLLLNLSSISRRIRSAAPGEVLTIGQWSRKLRTRFQLGLLGWIKGERIDQNLEVLSRSAEKLEQVATTQPVFQLWWVVGAVLEALREGGLDGSASIKRLLGHADREMKRLYEQGEGRYADSPPLELLNNLLYYVARARSSGPRVAAVRASFRLTELLPVDDHIEQARESLSAPSVKLMKTGRRRDQGRPRPREGRARYLRAPGRHAGRRAGAAAGTAEEDRPIRSACSASANCATRCRARQPTCRPSSLSARARARARCCAWPRR